MGLHKPSDIPTLAELSADKDVTEVLESVGEFDMKKTSQNILQYLSETQTYYPVIQVHDKCLLLAVNSKSFKGLIWLSGWVEVESAYRDSKNVYRVKLRINDRIVEVDYETLYPKDIIKLSRYGLIINFDYADSLSKYLFRIIARLEVKEKVNGMGFIMQEGELTFRAYDEKPQILQYTVAKYVGGLNKLLTNADIMFALCCSCASLFLAFLSLICGIPLMSFIISFYGKSTTGKSTSQFLMASVFTNPKDKKLYIPLFGTRNALLKMISQKFGIPQLFDEATIASSSDLDHLIYTITGENGKGRCNGDGHLKETDTWSLIVNTSSENNLLVNSHMHNKGIDARVLCFQLKFTDDREHSDRIHEFCGKHFGILGKALSEYLLNADPENVAGMYEECRKSMRVSIDDTAYFDLTERLVNEYALILLAAKVLIDFGVNIDVDAVTAIMTENHNEICESTNIADKYYQHLVTYAVMHPYTDGIKKDEANNTMAFIDELFLKVLEGYGASNPDLVIKELDAAGYIFRRKKNSIKNRLRFNGTLVNCYEIILPKDDSESDDGCMTLEYILTHFEGVDES